MRGTVITRKRGGLCRAHPTNEPTNERGGSARTCNSQRDNDFSKGGRAANFVVIFLVPRERWYGIYHRLIDLVDVVLKRPRFSRSISYHLCVTNESMNFFSLTLSSRFLFLLLYWYGWCLERTRLKIFYSVVGRFIIFRSNNVVENSFTNKFIEKFSLIKITRDSSNFRFHFLLEFTDDPEELIFQF